MLIVDRIMRLIGYCGTLCTGSDAGVAVAYCAIHEAVCQALVDTRGGYTLDWVIDIHGGYTLLDWVTDTHGDHTHTAGLGH